MLTLALAGRPNVGKSTLFNRLIGKKLALVEDVPGVTRDWREGNCNLHGLNFRVIDTAGLALAAARGSLSARATQHALGALRQANIIIMVIDAKVGLTADDLTIAGMLRKTGIPIRIAINKCEGLYLPNAMHDDLAAVMRLGFGEPLLVSALHGDGMDDIYTSIAAAHAATKSGKGDKAAQHVANNEDETETDNNNDFNGEDNTPSSPDEDGAEQQTSRLHLAIIGRPNAGKSTLVNKLLGQERQLTGAEAGLTRDAIAIEWNWQGQHVRLVDTAGLRRRSRIDDHLEEMSAHESIRAIRLAHAVVLVMDAAMPFDKQDYILANHVVDEGRALVIALNKWDTIKNPEQLIVQVRASLDKSLAQVPDVPVVIVSAKDGIGIDELMRTVTATVAIWNKRLPTNPLNRWLEAIEERNPPPLASGRRLKLRYITQIKGRPPTFALWVNNVKGFPESYKRFLTNNLRDTFGLAGVPIRWVMKKSKNPYEGKKTS